MSRLPDLVRDTKLDTIFDGPFTVHHFDDSDDENDARSTCRSKSWGFVRQLGRGGFSEVLLQKCEQDQRGPPRDLRAVKVIQRSRLGDNNLDYMNELEAISKFSQKRYSKCFVKFLGWYDDPKSLYIAMEYFPLGDLQKYMSNSGPMPEADTQEVVYQILDGLCFMHREGLAHRDVKPGNILIKARPPERKKWWVKLSDFGISKRIEESAYVQSTIKGTPPYMAPELVFYQRGSCSPIDHQKADMWALGEMSFRMLTKKATFVDLSAVARYSADPELFPSDQLDHHNASPEAKSFIRSLLELRPNDRLPADKAREHSWIQSCRTAEPSVTSHRPKARPSSSSRGPPAITISSSDSPDRGQSAGHCSNAELTRTSPDPWETLESSSEPQDRTLRPVTGSHPDVRTSYLRPVPWEPAGPSSSSKSPGHSFNARVSSPGPDAPADDDDGYWKAPASAPASTPFLALQRTVTEDTTQFTTQDNALDSTTRLQRVLVPPPDTSEPTRLVEGATDRSMMRRPRPYSDLPLRPRVTSVPRSRQARPTKHRSITAPEPPLHRNVLIVGDSNCGKSDLFHSFGHFNYLLPVPSTTTIDDHTSSHTSTLVSSIVEVRGERVKLTLCDTHSQHDYDRTRPLTYPDSDVILIAFAIDSPDSLDSVEENWIDEVLRFYNGRPIILVGCKLDLRRNDRTIEELRKKNQHPLTYEEGEEVRKRIRAFMYLECSAKTGEGVRDIFERATRATMYTPFDEFYYIPNRNTDVKKRGWRQRLRTFVYYKVHK